MPLSRNTGSLILNPDPRNNYLVYSEDTQGNEYYQLFFYDLDSKKARRLTDGISRHTGATFDLKGERMAFLGRAPNSAETRFAAALTYEALSQRKRTLEVLYSAPSEVLMDLSRWPDVADLSKDTGFQQLLVSQHLP